MRFEVRHLTRYRYAAPVRLGPHWLRLAPRAEVELRHEIAVLPQPAFRSDEVDAHGNRVIQLGFEGVTRQLTILSQLSADTGRAAPLMDQGARDRYLERTTNDPAVERLSARLKALSGPDPAAFAASLTRALHGMIEHDFRDTGFARTPGETLARRAGACRDTAVLFIELCRGAGLPARFVSGYQDKPTRAGDRRHMHAWAEVWLPGRGWVGFDPTRGTQAGDTHLALAAAPGQSGTMPIEGTFYGAGASAQMDYALDIKTL